MRQVICRGRQAHTMRLLAACSLTAIVSLPASVIAAPPGCKSITKGSLDVELPAGQRSSRMVRLRTGETVKFSLHGGASGATVMLVSGEGAPKALLTAGSGGLASFCAPADATYVFAIEAGRDDLTSVAANCLGSEQTATAPGAAPQTEIELAQIEADPEGLTRRSAFSLGLSEFASSARAADGPLSQWADPADAAMVDTEAADADERGATVLSFSTNAEVRPDDLSDVLARMTRVSANQAPAEVEAQTAMSTSAILDPGLSFAALPQAKSVQASAAGKRDAAKTAPAVELASDDWWITHVRSTQDTDTTETAVLRRDASAASGSFPPPMALGAFLPPETPTQ